MTLRSADEYDFDDFDPDDLGLFLLCEDPELIEELAEEYGMNPDQSLLVRLAQAMASEDEECR